MDGETKSGKWLLFVLPLITVLREGEKILSAYIFRVA